MKKIRPIKNIKPNPINKETSIPEYIKKRRDWQLYGYEKDYLTLGHFLDKFLEQESYLVLNTKYGSINKALLDCGNEIVSIDDDESEYDTLPQIVKNTFKMADITSPVLFLGQFDVVLSAHLNDDCYTDKDFNNLVDFISRHSNKYIILLIDVFNRENEYWIKSFKKRDFQYREDLKDGIIESISEKVKEIPIKNLLIFEKLEKEDAGSSKKT